MSWEGKADSTHKDLEVRRRRQVTELQRWPGSEDAGKGWRAVGTGPKQGTKKSQNQLHPQGTEVAEQLGQTGKPRFREEQLSVNDVIYPKGQ